MKTKILFILLAFSLMSATCEPDPIEPNCKCGTIIEKIYFNVPNQSFTKLTIKNNCTGETHFITVPSNQGNINEQWCE